MTNEEIEVEAEAIASAVIGKVRSEVYTNIVAEIIALCIKVREGDADAVPTNWTDSLLTGPDAALKGQGGSWGCPDIERLLQAVKERIRAGGSSLLPSGMSAGYNNMDDDLDRAGGIRE